MVFAATAGSSAGADTGVALGARCPVSTTKTKTKKREEEGEKKRREREIMLVSYYNLNNEVFAICSERNNVKMQIFSKENGHKIMCSTNLGLF